MYGKQLFNFLNFDIEMLNLCGKKFFLPPRFFTHIERLMQSEQEKNPKD